ncbi:MAG: Uma2 family endonuclease, partial [Peptococcaceae bacterium]|nr:Uma2 family endonuclease [Peptococcaceae bacterium]
MTEVQNLKSMSFEDFEVMERKDGWQYELMDGMVMMAPPPTGYHQEIVSNILEKLFVVLDLKKCRPFSETACRTEDSYLIPDLSVRCLESQIPVIVFEVLSPSTRLGDLLYKPLQYKKRGYHDCPHN